MAINLRFAKDMTHDASALAWRLRGFGAPWILAAMLAFSLVGASAPAFAGAYAIDKDHTEVRFSWNHLGLSRQSGRFLDVSGTLEFDPAEPEAAYADVTIQLASLSTGVPALDDALMKTRDFFDVETFPTATFKSTAVKRTGGKTARMTGDLTMNGATHSATLEVTWNFTGEHPMAQINPVYAGVFASGFSATTQIRRSDWGITRTIPYVSDEIEIAIETEMHRQGASEPETGASGVSPEPGVTAGEAQPP